jgi:hypothetical protein
MRKKQEISAKNSNRGQMPLFSAFTENDLLKNEEKWGKMRDSRAKNCPRLGLYKVMGLLEMRRKRKNRGTDVLKIALASAFTKGRPAGKRGRGGKSECAGGKEQMPSANALRQRERPAKRDLLKSKRELLKK